MRWKRTTRALDAKKDAFGQAEARGTGRVLPGLRAGSEPPEEVAKLKWVGTEPLLLPVWAGDSVGCVALFHSEQMDEYVEEALKHVVQGDGLEITQGELLKRIRDEVGIQAW